eukprot:10593587-Lingulodinium_polyedra.AAC.1
MRLFQQTKYALSYGVSVDVVPEHVVDHWYYGPRGRRLSTSRNRALQGVFAAHWNVWMRIASNGDKGAL